MTLPFNAADIDVLEAGNGPLVVLVHSSVSGARQWRKLIEALAGTFQVKAVNLFGYGRTPAWTEPRPQTFDDQAGLIGAIIPDGSEGIALVGHSFGATVAMHAAAKLGNRVSRLVLLEPNPFPLLRGHGRPEAFAEAMQLRDFIKHHGARDEWHIAAARFADYWGGPGTWDATAAERRAAFAEALKPNFHEWDTAIGDATCLETWCRQLPTKTLVAHDPNTVRPIREIVELMAAATPWEMVTIPSGGHMAPLTHPQIVNPIVEEFLRRR